MKTISADLRILIIEDNPVDLFLIEQMLEASPLKTENIFSTDRISRACQLLQEQSINIVLLDLSLPDSFGIQSLVKVKNASSKIPIIVLTGMNDSSGVVEALKQGAQDYLIKGEFTEHYLAQSIKYSIERKKAEEKTLGLEKELARQQKLKQMEITHAVIVAQENQSNMIGEELHDNISQILATVKLYLHEAMCEEEPRRVLITRSHKNVSLVIEEIRKLSKLLIAPSLNDIGLKASIRELIRNIQFVKKIKIKLAVASLTESCLNKEQQITIYRILQEQLNNIMKYADASSVIIEIKKEEDTLSLVITDDGNGFDPTLRRNGIGLINITSRAELLNGKVQIISAIGKGCTLKVIFYSAAEAFEDKLAIEN